MSGLKSFQPSPIFLGISLLFVAPVRATAAESVRCTIGSVNTGSKIYPNAKICTITEPDVKVPLKEYPQIAYNPGDEISITAGGCVQTGGSGKTWKNYISPRGSGSGILYHGLSYLPGVWQWRGGVTTYPQAWTWDGNDVKRVGDAMSRGALMVTNQEGHGANWLHLWLGYEDDNYGDNGYWGHDDGNDDQCKNSQNAYVIVTIIPHPENPQPQAPSSTGTPPWAGWSFPPPVTRPPPPNPFRVTLGPSFSSDAPNRTMNYSGSYLSLSFGCPNPSVSQVTNGSSLPIVLAYGSLFPDPLADPAIPLNQSSSSFAGNCANGQWKAVGVESGSYIGKWNFYSIDVWWTCAPACSTHSPLTSATITKGIALTTANGHYLTVVSGGGLGGPNTGPGAVALHTDAAKAGPWETFHVEWVDATHFALKTTSGNYVTAVNGGGIGGPNDNTSPIHTDATGLGPWEKLMLKYDASTRTATIQTPNGRYLTAVNGGGIGGSNHLPIHTDATKPGPWETFSFVLTK